MRPACTPTSIGGRRRVQLRPVGCGALLRSARLGRRAFADGSPKRPSGGGSRLLARQIIITVLVKYVSTIGVSMTIRGTIPDAPS